MEPTVPDAVIRRSVTHLYVAHFLASWGDRMWDFALALLFIQIWRDSLLLVALYGLIQSASVTLFGMAVGRCIDEVSRRRVITVALVVQNLAVTVSSLGVLLLLLLPGAQPPEPSSPPIYHPETLKTLHSSQQLTWHEIISNSSVLGVVLPLDAAIMMQSMPTHSWSTHQQMHDWLFVLIVVAIITVAGIGSLADLAMNVGVERDWVVVLSEVSTDESLLAEVNAGMKRIDLFCRLCAPSAVGFIMSIADSATTTILIMAWNLVTAGIEYYLLISVHDAIPAMATKKAPPKVSGTPIESNSSLLPVSSGQPGSSSSEWTHGVKNSDSYVLLPGDPPAANGSRGSTPSWLERAASWTKGQLADFSSGWTVYIRQETLLPSMALAFLYLTVLSFGSLMTAYLSWQGVPPGILGVVRGVSALTGIVGTLIYPILERRMSIQKAGLYAIWSQWIFLVLCAIGAFEGAYSSILLMTGVIFSRVGLWMFDLAAIQLVQVSVKETERGVVGGVQGALQKFFFLLIYVAAIAAPCPHDFWILIELSFAVASAAALLYSFYTWRHLSAPGY